MNTIIKKKAIVRYQLHDSAVLGGEVVCPFPHLRGGVATLLHNCLIILTSRQAKSRDDVFQNMGLGTDILKENQMSFVLHAPFCSPSHI